jgi:hypothetical protein
MELCVASRAADRIVILAGKHGIDGFVVRALPDLDGTRGNYSSFSFRVYEGSRAIGLKARDQI